MPAHKLIEGRLKHLESHLEQENPILLNTVQSFRKLDRCGYAMGLLENDESYATQIPWWPLISILGTFSAGKSTFINHFLEPPGLRIRLARLLIRQGQNERAIRAEGREPAEGPAGA